MEPQLNLAVGEKLSFKEKLAYAMGNVPGGFFGTFMGSIQAFYYAWMGLDIVYIGITQILYGVWNMINDPIFAYLQDKTRREEGRYKPWIKWFTIPFTIGFILVFIPPQSWRLLDGGEQYQIALASWYLVSQMIYDTAFTIMYLAHVALAPQMTMNEKERTQINILGSLMNFVGMGVAAAFPIASLNNPGPEDIRAFQIGVIIFGMIAILPWFAIIKWVKERKEFIPPKSASFWENIKYVFSNPSGRAYMIYDGISVGLLNALLTGLIFMIGWVFGIDNPYLPEGSTWGYGNLLPYLIPPVIGLIIGIIILLYIPKKWDVKRALWFSMIAEAIGFTIAFLGVLLSSNLEDDVFVVPNRLWVVSAGLTIAFLGFSGDFIYHNVMRAETIDMDEYRTGERRESIYAGVGCVLSKPMISVSLWAVPAIMNAFGLRPRNPNDPTGSSALIPDQGLRNATIGTALAIFLYPALLALIGAIAWYWYPINREEISKIHLHLKKVHEKKKMERLNSDENA